MSGIGMEAAHVLARKVEAFVREVVVPFEADQRRDHHGGPTDELVAELKERARAAGVLTPHVLPDGGHLTQRETAVVLTATGRRRWGRSHAIPPPRTRATCTCWARWAARRSGNASCRRWSTAASVRVSS